MACLAALVSRRALRRSVHRDDLRVMYRMMPVRGKRHAAAVPRQQDVSRRNGKLFVDEWCVALLPALVRRATSITAAVGSATVLVPSVSSFGASMMGPDFVFQARSF